MLIPLPSARNALAGALAAIVAAGATAIDAPISGGPETLLGGTAGFFIGGDAHDVARFMPVAKILSDRIVHVGAIGSGATARIVNNMMIATDLQGLKEALSLGQQAGLAPEVMLPLLTGSPTANGILAARMGHFPGENDSVGFSVDGAVKGSAVFRAAAKEYGLTAPSLDAVAQSRKETQDMGHGGADIAAMIVTHLDRLKSP